MSILVSTVKSIVKIAALIGLLAIVCPAADKSMIFLVAGSTADFVSPLGASNLREVNSSMGQTWQSQAAVIGATTAFTIVGGHILKKFGHPKAARVLNYIVGGAHFGAAVWNVKERCKY
jgi:hypothetical protein